MLNPAIDHLHLNGTYVDCAEIQMYASRYFIPISELLKKLPRVILLLLKTNDCLRAVDNALGASVNTYVIIGHELIITSARIFFLSEPAADRVPLIMTPHSVITGRLPLTSARKTAPGTPLHVVASKSNHNLHFS